MLSANTNINRDAFTESAMYKICTGKYHCVNLNRCTEEANDGEDDYDDDSGWDVGVAVQLRHEMLKHI